MECDQVVAISLKNTRPQQLENFCRIINFAFESAYFCIRYRRDCVGAAPTDHPSPLPRTPPCVGIRKIWSNKKSLLDLFNEIMDEILEKYEIFAWFMAGFSRVKHPSLFFSVLWKLARCHYNYRINIAVYFCVPSFKTLSSFPLFVCCIL